ATWYEQWLRLQPNADQVAEHNPVYVPRNHLVEEALTAAVSEHDFSVFHTLLAAVTDPYERKDAAAHLEQPASMAYSLTYPTFCGTSNPLGLLKNKLDRAYPVQFVLSVSVHVERFTTWALGPSGTGRSPTGCLVSGTWRILCAFLRQRSPRSHRGAQRP